MTRSWKLAARPARMNLWQLEWLRLIRTPRALALCAIYIVLGLGEPILTKNQGKLLSHASHGIRIYAPPPTPADGISSYVGQASLIGLIAVVVITAGAVCFDSRQGLAIFLRTRVPGIRQLLIPRLVVPAAAATVAYFAGTVAAWYETDLLIGSLPAPPVFAGIICGTAYLIFAIAVTALVASMVRTTAATSAITLAILMVLPIAGTSRALSQWLPSTLANAPSDLASRTHELSHYLPAFAVVTAATAAAATIAAGRLRARQI